MMSKFEFKEIDIEGQETLEAIAAADRFNEWMYKTINPFCRGDVLEIGSGIGNISQFFLRDGFSLTLSDIRDNYCEILERQFADSESLAGVTKMDLVDPEFDSKHSAHLEAFDTVFALNVVEHIEDHELAIRNSKKLLRTGGNLIILVPAYQALYNKFDEELEHYRRYTKKTLGAIFGEGFKIIHKQHFNAAGIAGWFVSGRLMKNSVLPKGQMALYNTLVPIFKVVDKVILNQVGLSVITVAKKV